jgi:hypothetical protein
MSVATHLRQESNLIMKWILNRLNLGNRNTADAGLKQPGTNVKHTQG